MASVTYKGGTMTIGIEGLEDVAKELGVLRNKTPATVKVAINQTARQTRKLMIQRAKARYALLAAGRRHLNDLKQRKKATNADLSAELYVKSMRNDLGYFEHSPTTMFTGRAVANAPEYITARVLKSSPMKPLTDKEGKWSKGFLVRFANNGNEHIGMVQRLIGSYSEHTTTRSGAKRWTNKDGKVEKLFTMGSPSVTAMHNVIFPMIVSEAEEYLILNTAERIEWQLRRARERMGGNV